MSLTPEKIAVFIFGILVIALIVSILYRKLPKRLKTDKFVLQWKDLQVYCKDRNTWPDALKSADELLDKALKKRKFKGKTMGERMVSASKIFTDNDGVWHAHNLYKKVVSEEVKRLKEVDVKTALVSYRQALRDIGALKSDKPRDTK